MTAAGTADVVLNEYIPLWGCPVTLPSDTGHNFTSKLANVVYDRLGIHNLNTSAYHLCTNGGVKRVNHVLAPMLSIIGNGQTDWHVLLPHASSTCNNFVNAATGLVPNEIHMGCLSRFPLSGFEPDNVGGHQSLDRDRLAYINLVTTDNNAPTTSSANYIASPPRVSSAAMRPSWPPSSHSPP